MNEWTVLDLIYHYIIKFICQVPLFTCPPPWRAGGWSRYSFNCVFERSLFFTTNKSTTVEGFTVANLSNFPAKLRYMYYWPCRRSSSIVRSKRSKQNKNKANLQPSWPNKLGQQRVYYMAKRLHQDCGNKEGNPKWSRHLHLAHLRSQHVIIRN